MPNEWPGLHEIAKKFNVPGIVVGATKPFTQEDIAEVKRLMATRLKALGEYVVFLTEEEEMKSLPIDDEERQKKMREMGLAKSFRPLESRKASDLDRLNDRLKRSLKDNA